MSRDLSLSRSPPARWSCAGAAPAPRAQPPAPLDPHAVRLPGRARRRPASAASAGSALADRWLGDEPFDNPGGARRRAASRLAGAPAREPPGPARRQPQLRRDRRRSSTSPAAGSRCRVRRDRRSPLYAYQPVLRRRGQRVHRGERGRGARRPWSQQPSTAREVRAGLALSARSARRAAGRRRSSGRAATTPTSSSRISGSPGRRDAARRLLRRRLRLPGRARAGSRADATRGADGGSGAALRARARR